MPSPWRPGAAGAAAGTAAARRSGGGRWRFRRWCRQRRRIGRVGLEEVDHVGPVDRILQPGEAHLGTGDVVLRTGQKGVQVLVAPGLPVAGSQRFGVGKALHVRLRAADDVIEIGADGVLAALFDGVAGLALAEHLFPLLRRRRRQQRAEIGFHRSCGRCRPLLGAGNMHGRFVFSHVHQRAAHEMGAVNQPGANQRRGAKFFQQREMHFLFLPVPRVRFDPPAGHNSPKPCGASMARRGECAALQSACFRYRKKMCCAAL